MLVGLISILFLTLGGAWAQTKCCAPDIHEGFTYSVTGDVRDGMASWYVNEDSFYYDYTKSKEAYSHRIFYGDDTIKTSRLIGDHADKKFYVIQENNCTAYDLTDPMRKRCISDDARFEGTFNIGVGNQQFRANSWVETFKNSDGKVTGAGLRTYTESGCVQISHVSLMDDTVARMHTSLHMDVRPLISDESVFTPPAECRTTKAEIPMWVRETRGYKYLTGAL